MTIKEYLKGRPKKWAERMDLVDDKALNRKINYGILLVETLFILYAVNAWYDCPCAFRTCGIKHYGPDGVTLKWTAENLDCGYVEQYLSSQTKFFQGNHDLLPEDINETIRGGNFPLTGQNTTIW